MNSNRKPHSSNLGYVTERKCATGGHIVIYDRNKGFDIDADHRWIVMHEPSSYHLSVPSRPQAYQLMRDAAQNPADALGVEPSDIHS